MSPLIVISGSIQIGTNARRASRGGRSQRVAAAHQLARRRRRRQAAGEPREVRDALLDRARQRHEHGHLAGERLERLARVLFLVRDHQIGLEREDLRGIDVLRPADDRDAFAVLAVAGAADQPIAGTERDHAVGIAGHQRHDAARRAPEPQRAPEVVVDHRASAPATYSTRARVRACRNPTEDPRVAEAFRAGGKIDLESRDRAARIRTRRSTSSRSSRPRSASARSCSRAISSRWSRGSSAWCSRSPTSASRAGSSAGCSSCRSESSGDLVRVRCVGESSRPHRRKIASGCSRWTLAARERN